MCVVPIIMTAMYAILAVGPLFMEKYYEIFRTSDGSEEEKEEGEET